MKIMSRIRAAYIIGVCPDVFQIPREMPEIVAHFGGGGCLPQPPFISDSAEYQEIKSLQ